LPSLSESISDLVSSSEADEVVGFVCGEGFGLDAEDFFEFMAEAVLDEAKRGGGEGAEKDAEKRDFGWSADFSRLLCSLFSARCFTPSLWDGCDLM
jgi:hypothetical protein